MPVVASSRVGRFIFVVAVAACFLQPAPAFAKAKPKKPTIKSFTLVDAITKKVIPAFNPIPEGAVINLAELPKYINIRANVDRKLTKSVKFKANGGKAVTAAKYPFGIAGNKKKAAPNWNPEIGLNSVTAIPYAGLNGKGKKGTTKTVTFTVVNQLVIDINAPAIPNLADWQSNMTTFAAKQCNQSTINADQQFEGGVWYFDGIRVFYQIADYTQDPSWNTCAGYVRDVYRNYVLTNLTQQDGNIPGFRVFPQGLYMDFTKTGDPASKQAVQLLATHTGYAYTGGSADYHFSRETAYVIEAYLWAEQLGTPLDSDLKKAVGFAIGHIDQWVGGQTDFVQPYLVGITMEALIQYYERTHDGKVLPAVKKAADWLWATAWQPDRGQFYYISCKPGSTNTECGDAGRDASDLNLLIAPAYAWLYNITSSTTYLTEGDAIWSGAFRDTTYLNFGKQFSQNYHWSFDYVRWRAGKKTL